MEEQNLFNLAETPQTPPQAHSPSWAAARTSAPSWINKSDDGSNQEKKKPKDETKKSTDLLSGRRRSLIIQSQEMENLLSSGGSENLEPDQIGSFMRISDDKMRFHGMNIITTLLKQKIEDRDERYLSKCILTILRLSLESAFSSVRNAFTEILNLIKRANLDVDIPEDRAVITKWVSRDQLPAVIHSGDDSNDLMNRLLRNIDVIEGRVPHVIVVLAWHPTFLDKWYKTTSHLMRGNGPLPFTWRRYISIIACARFHCMPMLKLQEMDFLASGGEPTWITEGINAPSLPSKLYSLMELNGLLAHQPWRITPAKMEALLRESTWSLGELVHAISIMSTFHSICGLVWGLGVRPELDLGESTERRDVSFTQLPQVEGNNVNAHIIDMLKTGPSRFTEQRQSWMESGGEKKSHIWAQAEDAESTKMLRTSSNAAHEQYCAKYIGNFEMEYNDFDITSTEYSIFYKGQYNWENHGYALVHQVLDELAPLIGAELHNIRTLTYMRFGNANVQVDTSAFREAIWHYAHRIKGLLDDDYNYSEVNQLLSRQMKFFVKKITCFPQTITLSDFSSLGSDLLPEEKCHIALLATEASKEASLSYALKALSLYLKRSN